MSKLQLSIAVGDYDRKRAPLDGSEQIDGVDPVLHPATCGSYSI